MAAWRRIGASFLAKALQSVNGGASVAQLEYETHPRARYGWGKPPHAQLLALLAKDEAQYGPVTRSLFEHIDDLSAIPRSRDPKGSICWDNDFCGGLDAAVLYATIATRKPAVYMEVGSGYSTMFARRAVSDHDLATRVISVDPHPRAAIDRLCDEVVRQPLEDSDLSAFQQLGPGDVLFIDGSHTVFMGSDTTVVFCEILPALPAGVMIGIDDIFLPWDYPPDWASRWYAEQYLLATMLLNGSGPWSIQFPAWYLTQDSSDRARFDPIWQIVVPDAGPYAKSFWFEKVG